ncbi:hypothetical protein BCR44DRAFT_1436054 [Catenaria anguillulae PL171]|uniref:Uncharacterized protein n=1 Tax=Catenaria anguillulae PL171 TaxID=765915 RepID=A0A1Y2HJ14_9FUNG|nr:hypothetical protein BCR44DRAFT_1436054 [Catenaria anguillulae PL171]
MLFCRPSTPCTRASLCARLGPSCTFIAEETPCSTITTKMSTTLPISIWWMLP